MTPNSRTREKSLVLVIDDDSDMRFLVREALEAEGFEIDEAENGHRGIDAYQRQRPDIIIMDVMMPEMNGFDACTALRRLPGGERTPILMMTGLNDIQSIQRAYEVGATDFITKPINYLILGHRLHYMLRARSAMDNLCDSERRLANAQRIARLGSWEWLIEPNQLKLSEEAYQILGLGQHSPDELYQAILERVHPDYQDLFKQIFETSVREKRPLGFEHKILLPDGTSRVVCQEGEIVTDELSGDLKLVCTVQDITERKKTEQEIFRLVHYDPLTGLPNRAYLKKHLNQMLAQAKPLDRLVAVLALDLDQFKRINDTLGRNAGDILLQLVGQRLKGCTRRRDMVARTSTPETELFFEQDQDRVVARLDGDEFIILISEIHRPEDAALVAQRVMNVLSSPFQLHHKEIFITASIGIVIYPLNGTDVETLLSNAESAMHHAKERARNCYQFYSEAINARARELLLLESNLCRALELDEFELYYQPKVDLRTGQVSGAEALIRWKHPKMGIIPPSKFIPLTEEMGLIMPLGEWILRTACVHAKNWQEKGLGEMRVAVNLSARQFREHNLARKIAQILDDVGLAPKHLELEITEGILMENMDSSHKILTELRAMGLRIALDDFGTGYSSLNYLKRFPLNTLKIDQSFVRDISTDSDSAAIVSAIIALSHKLNLDVVAEGVETKEQLDFLRNHNCNVVQGFYFSAPLSRSRVTIWLKQEIGRINEITNEKSKCGQKEYYIEGELIDLKSS